VVSLDRRQRVPAAAAGVALIGVCWLAGAGVTAGAQTPVDDAARPWSAMWPRELRDLDGRAWTAENLRGRVVLLDFWATWCAPCLAQLPELRRLHHAQASSGLLVLGVNLDGGARRALRAFVARHDIDWPQFHDPRAFAAELPRRFGVESVPRTLLFDRAGRLVAVDLEASRLAAALPPLLEQPPPGSDR
jgi:thiol-disulfide isomerase/thioredoxin